MSNHQDEGGTIQLPSDQATAIRHAFVARHNAINDKARAAAKEIWDKASPAERKDARTIRDRLNDKLAPLDRRRLFQPTSSDQDAALERAQELLGVTSHYNATVRAPLKKNLATAGKTETRFSTNYSSVSFDPKKNTLRWEASGNHGAEEARGEWLWETMSNELERVRWTRGSGGVIWRSDEYDRNETPNAYGPIGLKEAPEATRPFVKSDGTRVTAYDIADARAKKLRGQARQKSAEARFARQQADLLQGRRHNGQFDFRRGSSPEIFLR